MSARQYIEYAYFSYLMSASFDRDFGDIWIPSENLKSIFRDALSNTLSPYGYHPTHKYDDIVNEAISAVEQRALDREGDEFTGTYLRIRVADKDDVFRGLLQDNPIVSRLATLGLSARERAFKEIARQEGWPDAIDAAPLETEGNSEPDIAPASDRIVTLSDNQVFDLDQKATHLIEVVEAQNQLGGEPGLRELMVGQLKAGRELIRAGSFKLYLIQMTLVDALQKLAKRYEREVIGALAAALVAALAQQLGLNIR